MPYLAPSQTQLITNAQNYLSSQLGYPILSTSIENILAVMTAMLVDDQYSFIRYCFSQTTPFQSSAPYLDLWAALKNLQRISANPASGVLNGFTGVSGTLVPSGTLLNASNGQQYSTEADYTCGVSTNLAVTAVNVGASGNCPVGTTATLLSSISGISNSTSTFINPAIGGSDVETDDSLRSRTIFAFSNPAQGGSQSDYIGWALSTDGVTRAWCIGNYIGNIPFNGAVTVYTMFDNTESANNGFPIGNAGVSTSEPRYAAATGDLLSVANQIYASGQPITAFVLSQAPSPQSVNIVITGLGFSNLWNGSWAETPSLIQMQILKSIQSMFVLNGSVYGNKAITTSQLTAAIASVAGVNSFNIQSPTTQIATAVGSLPVVGILTLQD